MSAGGREFNSILPSNPKHTCAIYQGLHAIGLVCSLRAANVLPHGGAKARSASAWACLTGVQVCFPPLRDLQLHAIPLAAAVVRPALAWRWIEPARSDAPLQPVALSSSSEEPWDEASSPMRTGLAPPTYPNPALESSEPGEHRL